MQPSIETSFEELVNKILDRVEQQAEQQEILQSYLKNHSDLFDVRFRSTYLDGKLSKLVFELVRTCSVAEDNIELLSDIVQNDQDLKKAYDLHKNRIIDKYNVQCGNRINPEVVSTISEKIGKKWMEFGHQLGVPDGIIDDLEKIPNYQEKIERMFAWLSKDKSRSEQEKLILKALEKARRTDLKEEVHDLIYK
ncbi:uncharacterized protein LOC132196726 [Neocloeon triangulifer]|uniref:uncharacterized protein LOC132196726 n=1 Tax=Neocloeon triangulifer TaxID=2078957 RepID=UPI00286F1549|nr:uncharacterized protein LOC132196726 [Neocloeon triangulifer]